MIPSFPRKVRNIFFPIVFTDDCVCTVQRINRVKNAALMFVKVVVLANNFSQGYWKVLWDGMGIIKEWTIQEWWKGCMRGNLRDKKKWEALGEVGIW